MKSHAILLLIALALIGSPACADDIDELAELLAGTFDSQLVEPDQPADERFVERRTRLNTPDLGKYVFCQQINRHENLVVYRQRILILEVAAASQQIEQRAYALRDAGRFVDADAAAFETLVAEDLHDFMADGCQQLWTKVVDGFRGYVDPETCRIISKRTGKLRAIESESRLTRQSVALVERGFDAESGEQLFGTPPGASLSLGRAR